MTDIALNLDDNEQAFLFKALQDLICIREGEGGKDNEVEDLLDLFNKLEAAQKAARGRQ